MTYRLLDLFCGAGGAAMGYARAGFEVVGVDITDQPDYPFEFHRADALTFPIDDFDAAHASPPCQAYVASRFFNAKLGRRPEHPRLIEPIRQRLIDAGLPYVIENVPQAPLLNAVTLCGSMFGLGVRRHRKFESPVCMWAPPRCAHRGHDFVGVYGERPGGRGFNDDGLTDGYVRKPRAQTLEAARTAMGMSWGNWHGVKEAIPPAYCQFIGEQLRDYLVSVAA